MNLFLQTSLSFPVVMLSFVLCIAILYWLGVAIGVLDVDLLDFNINGAESSLSKAEGLGGLLLKVGFKDLPVTLLLTLLIFFSWIFCYFIELLALRFVPLGWLRYPVGVAVAIGCILLALPLVRFVSAPLRPLFRKINRDTTRSVIGQVVTVRSGRVTLTNGEATMDDGGAGLVLRIRAEEALNLQRGDRVVLLEYLQAEHAYRVVTEKEFNGI
jgi:hypothetical protein